MPTLRFSSATDGFLPEATGQCIAFIRKENEFNLNKYVQYYPSPAPVGVYTILGRDEQIRVPTDAEFAWEDGDEAPEGLSRQESFTTQSFRTFRRAYPWRLGYQQIDTSKLWKPKLVHASSAISKCMTNRTKRVIDLLETTSNWGTNYASANDLNGGKGGWATASDDPDSPNYLAIYKSLIEAARRIHLGTNGKVRIRDLRVVISPGLAIAAAQSAEILNYQRETPQAKQIALDGFSDQEDMWTLPERYKGFKFVVEDSPIVTEAPKVSSGNLVEATTNRLYIKSDSSAVVCSRPGGLDGDYGAPSFSTIQIYHYQGLLRVQAFDEPKHERVTGRVVENIKEVLAAPTAGFLITQTM